MCQPFSSDPELPFLCPACVGDCQFQTACELVHCVAIQDIIDSLHDSPAMQSPTHCGLSIIHTDDPTLQL